MAPERFFENMAITVVFRAWTLAFLHAVGLILLSVGAWVPGLAADESAIEQPPPASTHVLTSEELNLGRRVFQRKCIKCHGSGREGAPIVGQPGAWARSLKQPVDILITHALNGHNGLHGQMPPKGGFAALSDVEVSAAVRYIVERGDWLATQIKNRGVACTKSHESETCLPVDPDDRTLLRLIWILSGFREER